MYLLKKFSDLRCSTKARRKPRTYQFRVYVPVSANKFVHFPVTVETDRLLRNTS